MTDKCDYYESCRNNRESEIVFQASLTEQMRGAIRELSEIAANIKFNNAKHWEAVGKLQEAASQEKQDRIFADGHIESKISYERGRAVGYAALISAGIAIMGIILASLLK